jgi:hypothetical protein
VLISDASETSTKHLRPRTTPLRATRRPSRILLVGVGILMALTFCRGLFWVVSFPVWSGDEGAHYSYEQSVATGRGIPVAGRNLNSADTLRLIKESPIATERTFPLPPTPSKDWGIVDEQYEGLQAPIYYVLLVPAYWIGRAAGGVIGSFYALRLASLLMAVAAIPLIALLARALLPRRPAVWLLAPAVVAVLQIVNVQNSYVDNDALTMVAGATSVLALLASRGDLRARRAALFGATLALAFLTKATLSALLPALLIAMFAYFVHYRPGWRAVVVWLTTAGGTFFVLLLPYLAFNIAEYHTFSGARAASALVKPVIGSTPVSLGGAWRLTETFLQTLFVGQGIAPNSLSVPYQHLWEWTAIVTAIAALGGAAVQRRREEFAIMAWIIVSIPLGVITLIVIGFNQSGTEATVVSRYLDCLLPLFAVLVGYGAVAALGSRAGSLALLAVLAAGSLFEVAGDRAWLQSSYTADIIVNSTPVVDQSYADGLASLSDVRASATCRVDAVALNVWGHPPSTVFVNGQRSLRGVADGTVWTEYRLSRPVKSPISVRLSQPFLLGTVRHQPSLAVSPAGTVAATASGLPTLRLYCPVTDPQTARFSQLYAKNHPPLSLGVLLTWPEVEAWVELMLVVAAAAVVFTDLVGPAGAHRKVNRRTGGEPQGTDSVAPGHHCHGRSVLSPRLVVPDLD